MKETSEKFTFIHELPTADGISKIEKTFEMRGTSKDLKHFSIFVSEFFDDCGYNISFKQGLTDAAIKDNLRADYEATSKEKRFVDNDVCHLINKRERLTKQIDLAKAARELFEQLKVKSDDQDETQVDID
jgi:hypothetical protein